MLIRYLLVHVCWSVLVYKCLILAVVQVSVIVYLEGRDKTWFI